jgi:hypothetical protein
MSVIIFSSSEISKVASSLLKEFGDFVHTYEEKQVAKQESRHEHEKRDDLAILLDNYRWFWERISIANQAEHLKEYAKYGESENITHDQISVHDTDANLKSPELYKKLISIRYNSSSFLAPKISEKLDCFIGMVADRVIKEQS